MQFNYISFRKRCTYQKLTSTCMLFWSLTFLILKVFWNISYHLEQNNVNLHNIHRVGKHCHQTLQLLHQISHHWFFLLIEIITKSSKFYWIVDLLYRCLMTFDVGKSFRLIKILSPFLHKKIELAVVYFLNLKFFCCMQILLRWYVFLPSEKFYDKIRFDPYNYNTHEPSWSCSTMVYALIFRNDITW